MFTLLEYFTAIYGVIVTAFAAYLFGLTRRLAMENGLNQTIAKLQHLFSQITFHPEVAKHLREMGFMVKEEQVDDSRNTNKL